MKDQIHPHSHAKPKNNQNNVCGIIFFTSAPLKSIWMILAWFIIFGLFITSIPLEFSVFHLFYLSCFQLAPLVILYTLTEHHFLHFEDCYAYKCLGNIEIEEMTGGKIGNGKDGNRKRCTSLSGNGVIRFSAISTGLFAEKPCMCVAVWGSWLYGFA